MHLSRICAALRHLVLETVQLAEHIHRDAHMMLGKALHARRVMQQHIRVEHKSFHPDG